MRRSSLADFGIGGFGGQAKLRLFLATDSFMSLVTRVLSMMVPRNSLHFWLNTAPSSRISRVSGFGGSYSSSSCSSWELEAAAAEAAAKPPGPNRDRPPGGCCGSAAPGPELNLNPSVLRWIQSHVADSPYCVLTPVFRDYERHLADIERRHPYVESSATANSSTGTAAAAAATPTTTSTTLAAPLKASTSPAKFNFSAATTSTAASAPTTAATTATTMAPAMPATFSFNSQQPQKPATDGAATTATFFFGASAKSTTASSTSTTTTTATSATSTTGLTTASSGFTGFKFNSGPGAALPQQPPGGLSLFGPGGFAAASAAAASSSQEEQEDEEYEPPKPETREIREDGAVFSQKCKLFYMAAGEAKQWKEKGVGCVHVKPAEAEGGSRAQLIVRADNTLGTIMLNTLVTKDMKLSVAKNNLSLACPPNPPMPKSANDDRRIVPFLATETCGGSPTEFADLLSSARLLRAIRDELGYARPGAIQARCISLALSGADLLCQAPSGSGKSTACAVAVTQRLLTLIDEAKRLSPASADLEGNSVATRALVLCHSRELAVQTVRQLRCLSSRCPGRRPRVAEFLGGAPGRRCTPIAFFIKTRRCRCCLPAGHRSRARLAACWTWHAGVTCAPTSCELLCWTTATSCCCRDEAVQALLLAPPDRQVLMCCTTISAAMRQQCLELMQNPHELCLSDEAQLAPHSLLQYRVPIADCGYRAKNARLLKLLRVLEFEQVHLALAIVFVNSPRQCDSLGEIPEISRPVSAGGARGPVPGQPDGELPAVQELQAAHSNQHGFVRLLFQRVGVVINYCLPADPGLYLYRIGRAAHFGSRGLALTLQEPDSRR
uniref:RNA helicase n=1 Tax=Macrostomum lignano TaxID=282301 RepID=A0A1I8F2H9_9PLAT